MHLAAQPAIHGAADPHEHEADVISSRVGDQAEQCLHGLSNHNAVDLERYGHTEAKSVQTKASSAQGLPPMIAPPIVHEALRSPGRPLDPDTRKFIEPRFGHDFSQVRIHTGEEAAASSRALNAQAYTVGRDIVFGDQAYAPQNAQGMRLLAHELTHVVQQGLGHAPVVQCAPDALKKYSTKQKVWDSDAKAIDAAIAQSPVIAKYGPKKLKAEKGHVETWDKEVFESQYTTYATGLGESAAEIQEDLKTVAGFTDRKSGKIHLLNHVADVEAMLHEAIHLNSAAQFQNNFGHYMNEGVTQHFTEAVLSEQKLDPGKAYRDQLAMADGLISVLGEDQVGPGYFQGKIDGYKKIVDAFSHSTDNSAFRTWHTRINSSNHKDWADATDQLRAIMHRD